MGIPIDIGGVVSGVMNGLDELFTSDEEREKAKLVLMQELNKPHIMQAAINIEEAKHPSLFVAGWRPALGWLCVILLGYAWMGRDLLSIILGITEQYEVIAQLPAIDTGDLMTLVLALLGLGATRMYEKLNGVARTGWKPKEDK